MNKSALTIAIGLSLGASSPPGEETLTTDGQFQPPLVEGAYTFECPAIRATVRYRQERREPVNVPRPEDLQVTLLELTVSGASLPPDQFASAGEVFRSFAWIQNVGATCFRGSVTIAVHGMPHRLFFDAILGDACVPVHRTSTIGLSASGVTHATPFNPRDEALRCPSRP